MHKVLELGRSNLKRHRSVSFFIDITKSVIASFLFVHLSLGDTEDREADFASIDRIDKCPNEDALIANVYKPVSAVGHLCATLCRDALDRDGAFPQCNVPALSDSLRQCYLPVE